MKSLKNKAYRKKLIIRDIKYLNLPFYIENILRNNGITTIAGLLNNSKSYIYSIRGIEDEHIIQIEKILIPFYNLLPTKGKEVFNIEEIYKHKLYKLNIPNFKSKEEENLFKNIRIEDLSLSTRVKNTLNVSGIRTISGILNFNKKYNLNSMVGLGDKGAEEIIKLFNNYSNISKKDTQEISEIQEDIYKIPDLIVQEEITSLNLYNIENIIHFFSMRFGLDNNEILSKTRKSNVVIARDFLVYFLREYCNMSFPSIGEILGGRDHTTIMHSYNKIKNNLKYKILFENKFQELILNYYNSKQIILDKENSLKIIDDRDLKVFYMYKDNLTLKVISKKIGVTGERVRQIIKQTINTIIFNSFIINDLEIDHDLMKKEEEFFLEKIKKERKPVKKEVIKIYKWSRLYDFCIQCKSTEHKHYKKGLCEVCGSKTIYGKEREDIIFIHNNECDLCKKKRDLQLKEHNRDFYISRKDNTILCRTCFLNKNGKILSNFKRL